jgi:hypothetical protein
MGVGGGALARLEEAADALLAETPLVEGDMDALVGYLAPFRTQLNRCELAFARVAGRLSDAYFSDGYGNLSPTQALRYDCKMASGAAAAAINVGEELERMPLSTAALEDGRIGFAHLNLIAQTAAFCGNGFREDKLLARAEDTHVTGFARICAHARHAADPKRFAQEERELYEARFLELSTRSEDGAVFLKGLLDAEGGAYVRTALETLAQKQPNDDRLVGQRNADALVEIAKVALDEGRLPERGGVRPHVQVTATLETLLGLPGAAAAELEGAGPISIEMLRRIAGDCSIRRLLLDEDSMVIDVGRERRLFRGASRVALDNRDKGCVWPGCTRSARFCQADHDLPWFVGGDSDRDNGRLLCRYHHRLRSDGWQVVRAEDQWVVKPPLWSPWSRAG